MVAGINPISGAGHNVFGHKLSTVVTGNVTGDNVVYDLADADLAMKLHYLRLVYYFRPGGPVEGLRTPDLKQPMFPLLDLYYPVAGRVRRDKDGRPHLKCNDSGVRIIEARCGCTLDEWLAMEEDSGRHRRLVSDKTLGPDLHFSPTMLVQFTKFNCGGLAVGISWAHVLGDAVSVINCINLWGQLLSGSPQPKPQRINNAQVTRSKPLGTSPIAAERLAVKQVGPVGDHWRAPGEQTMATLSLLITENKLKDLQTKITENKLNELQTKISPFEALAALFWRCLAGVRAGSEPTSVTICSSSERGSRILGNYQKFATITSESYPSKLELSELAVLIREQAISEKTRIDELVDCEEENPDGANLVVYGAKLTFVDMEDVNFSGLELMGQKPAEIEFFIDGVGEEGAVLVRQDGNGGRVVMLILLEDQLQKLKEVLHSEWEISA